MQIINLNKLNISKIAGIKKILTIDILDDSIRIALFQRKENIFKLSNKTSISNFSVISIEIVTRNFDLIPQVLQKYLIDYKLKNLYVLIGINDCLYQKLNIPSDNEDDDMWLLENEGKFIPEGRPKSEFIFSYRKIKGDDNSHQYLVITARKDYIENIIKSCSGKGINILAITPFITSSLIDSDLNENNSLFINVLNNKIQYAQKDIENNFSIGEIYFSESLSSITNEDISIPILHDALTKLTQLYFNIKPSSSVRVFISCPNQFIDLIREFISSSLYASVNLVDNKLDSGLVSALYAVRSIFSNNEAGFNLLTEEEYKAGWDVLEKQVWLNITIAGGVIIMVLMLLSNLLTLKLETSQSNYQDESTELSSKQDELKKLEDENRHFKTNLDILYKLKEKKSVYSSILFELDKITNSRSCLTDIEAMPDSLIFDVNIAGLAHNQSDVADIIRKVESLRKFSNVTLLYSSSDNESNSFGNADTVSKNLIKYSMRFKYSGN